MDGNLIRTDRKMGFILAQGAWELLRLAALPFMFAHRSKWGLLLSDLHVTIISHQAKKVIADGIQSSRSFHLTCEALALWQALAAHHSQVLGNILAFTFEVFCAYIRIQEIAPDVDRGWWELTSCSGQLAAIGGFYRRVVVIPSWEGLAGNLLLSQAQGLCPGGDQVRAPYSLSLLSAAIGAYLVCTGCQ